jgi:hypothetical protein
MKNQTLKVMEEHRDENHVTKSWHQHAINNVLDVCLFEFMKLIQMAIVQVISNVEDEITFFTLTFIKFQL